VPLGAGTGPRAGGAAVRRRHPRGRSGAAVTRRANPVVQEETTKGIIEAMKQSPVPVPQPDDPFGTFLFTFVAPVGVALFSVFMLFIFSPESILGKDQMKEYTEAEIALEEKRRGVKAPAPQSRGVRRRQRREQQKNA